MDNPIHVRLARLSVNSERGVMRIAREINPMIRNIRRGVVSDVANEGIDSQTINTEGAVNVSNQIFNGLNEDSEELLNEVAQDIIDLAMVQAEAFVNVINSSFEGDPVVLGNINPSDLLTAINLEGNYITNSTIFRNELRNLLATAGIGGGHTNSDILDILGRERITSSTLLSRYSNGFRTTLIDGSRAAINQARFAVIQDNPDIIEGIQHISILDSSTSLQCSARAGLQWLNNEERTPVGHSIPFEVPPIHRNCRSTIVPVFRDAEALEAEGIIIDPSVRSVIGEAMEDADFDTFLQSVSRSEGIEILGAGRYNEYINKNLTPEELLDMSGRPLTLEELRRRNP